MGILDIFGGNTDREDRAARQLLERSTGLYGNIELPEFQQLTPEQLAYVGDVTAPQVDAQYAMAPDQIQMEYVDPRLADVTLQDRSEMFNVSTDPRLRDAQLGALEALGGIAESGGMTLRDEANLGKLQSEVSQADRGRREAILQNMQMRGQGGSGLELLAQLQSAQDATTDASAGSRDIAAQAQDRALRAIMQQGALGGQIRGQEFGEQADLAKAQDIINAFNAGNLTQGSQFNADTVNTGQRFNVGNSLQTQGQNIGNVQQNRQFNAGQGQSALTGNADRTMAAMTGNRNLRQDVAGTNVGARNQAQQFNKFTIPQQGFENTMAKTQGMAGGLQNQAGFQQTLGDRKKAEAAETFGAVVKGGTALGSAYLGRGAK